MAMLEVRDLSVNYGVIQAVKNVSFEINQGEIVTLIGANGAGKSTIVKTISGLLKPKSGQIFYLGKEIDHKSAPQIVSAGISQVAEGRHIFAGMTVMENLQMGAFLQKNHDEVSKTYKEIFERFPILQKRRSQDAATLSGGEQQMLAMGRALMAKPKLLLLDEPSMGLSPLYIQEIFKIIKELNEKGTTILLIEQNAKQALSIADRGYVLATGVVQLSGTGQELLANPEVQKVYFGG
ncbi:MULTISPECIES: ABC transporter ATP-binding protein [Lactobacillus]|uniref:ABC transporter ATP-binding protein n=1 Tax=Lactobacillus melliventris TaxID=1218507 RepID=A0ABX5N386_9LACO|nr:MULTISPECIES: ABC transporter ATP-binding protein [Lactobacillus]MCT6902350.1 ABC transporter ATP-binding protein [Lactobacillus sp.]MBC6349428.1 ABC transporter ATP-binding protein [Lactobacillus melliventris]MBH9988878.1 ABC transporter ATP-binding protein [Lactobacillus sp. M0392]MBI0023503.1 ABC transporter ATP-binding protein [Lactobacillus sp. W8171]MBI0043908.1 ABC transporter ATP-binding protein [Lactobacillus sp. M0393]